MQICLTKPIEEFIERQVARGYSSPEEVLRQACLRWMAEEDFDPAPPGLADKIEAARGGAFRPFSAEKYSAILDGNEASR